jgi:hypothetical protein
MANERFLSRDPRDERERHVQLQAEIQQCRIDMVYGSLLDRRRLERQIMRAEAEICRLPPPR